MSRIKAWLVILAVCFGLCPKALASFYTNNFANSAYGTNTIQISLHPNSTYFVLTNGEIIYTEDVSLTATNGILTTNAFPTGGLAPGNYTVTIGPKFDKFIGNVPYDNNVYPFWTLITNAQFATTNISGVVLGVAPGVNVTTSTNNGVVTVNSSGGGGGGPGPTLVGGGIISSNNALWWGATGRGQVDDYPALQNWLNYISTAATANNDALNPTAPSNSLNFVWPAGTYLCSHSLNLTNADGAHITGAGTATQLIWTGPASEVPLLLRNANTCVFEDFCICSTNTNNYGFPYGIWQYTDTSIPSRLASGENIYRHVFIQGLTNALIGGGFSSSPSNGVDVGNEESRYEYCQVFNWKSNAFDFEGQNNLRNLVFGCHIATYGNIGAVGCFQSYADYTWVGAAGYDSCDTNFVLSHLGVNPVSIQYLRCENSLSFLQSQASSQNFSFVNAALDIEHCSIQVALPSNNVATNFIVFPQNCVCRFVDNSVSQPAVSNLFIGLDYEPQNPWRNSLYFADNQITSSYGPNGLFINSFGFNPAVGMTALNNLITSNGDTYFFDETGSPHGENHYGGRIETGGLFVNKTPQVSIPGVSPVGTTGSTSYSYCVTGVTSAGVESAPSGTNTITTGNAMLSAVNYNQINIGGNSTPGMDHFNVYRVAGGSTQGLIGAIRNNYGQGNLGYFRDTGQSAIGSVPTVDSSGNINAQGYISANDGGLTSTGPNAGTYVGDRNPAFTDSQVFSIDDGLGSIYLSGFGAVQSWTTNQITFTGAVFTNGFTNFSGKIGNATLTPSTLIGTDANDNQTSVAIGSGLSLSGGTLTATGGGGGASTFSPQFGYNAGAGTNIVSLAASLLTGTIPSASIQITTNNLDRVITNGQAVAWTNFGNIIVTNGTLTFSNTFSTLTITSNGFNWTATNGQGFALTNGALWLSQILLANLQVTNGPLLVAGVTASNTVTTNGFWENITGSIVASLTNGVLTAQRLVSTASTLFQGTSTNRAVSAGTTNQCFTINTAYYNISTNAMAGGRCSGSATFSITPSVTVAASVGIVVLMNNGTYYTNQDIIDPVTGVTGTFQRTVQFDFADTNAIIFPTNFSAAGPTVTVSASHINFL